MLCYLFQYNKFFAICLRQITGFVFLALLLNHLYQQQSNSTNTYRLDQKENCNLYIILTLQPTSHLAQMTVIPEYTGITPKTLNDPIGLVYIPDGPLF
jgi:hypothetical protein